MLQVVKWVGEVIIHFGAQFICFVFSFTLQTWRDVRTFLFCPATNPNGSLPSPFHARPLSLRCYTLALLCRCAALRSKRVAFTMASDSEEDEDEVTNNGRKQGEPEKVVVFGSGIEAVNGEYVSDGRSRIYLPRYLMWRTLDGKMTEYSLELVSLVVMGISWSICIDGDEVFCCDYQELLPCRGWWQKYVDSEQDYFRPPVVFYGDETFLDWRLEPEHSLADYKIEVVCKKDGAASKTTTYNTHQVILANASSYFSNLLLNKAKGCPQFAQQETNTSRFELKPLAASNFPYLLDFIYWQFSNSGRPSKKRSCFCRNVQGQDVVLYWLADCFGVSQLLRDKDYDINLGHDQERCLQYLPAAFELGVPRIIDSVLQFCIEERLGLDKDELAAVLDLPSLIYL
jgi:hypothetical protein